jgi:hypothetical protein
VLTQLAARLVADFAASFLALLVADIHLTNVAVQKKGPQYDAISGGKMDLRTLKLYVHSKHGAEKANKMFHDIQARLQNSLLS